jgi:Kef-type K+ transport system membrane component KefB
LRIAQDERAQGQVTERMLLLSATNTAFAVLALAVLLPMPSSGALGLRGALVDVGASFAIAALLTVLALGVFVVLGKRRETQLSAAFGVIALGAGAAQAAQLSIPFVLFVFGVLVRAADRAQRMPPLELGRAGQLVTVLLFALVGASLDVRLVAGFGVAALAFIAARALAKAAAVILFARVTRQPLRQAALLALTLQPMSGVTFVLAHDAASALPALAASVVPIVLAAVVAFELLGPLCVRSGLRLAGEAEPLAA